jgi:hypothetical protein
MLAAASSSGRTPDGRFALGHSGNPAGRPKGSRNRGTLLVAALREGEDAAIHRRLIEAALGGDLVAARFCAARIDAAAHLRTDEIELDLTRTEALNPFIVHAKLVQAMVEGRVGTGAAVAATRVLAAKKQLEAYYKGEIEDDDYAALQEDDDESEDYDEGECDEEETDAEDDDAEAAGDDDADADPDPSATAAPDEANSPPEPSPAMAEGEGTETRGEGAGTEAAHTYFSPCGGGAGWGVAAAPEEGPPATEAAATPEARDSPPQPSRAKGEGETTDVAPVRRFPRRQWVPRGVPLWP